MPAASALPTPLSIDVCDAEGHRTIVVGGELDLATAPELAITLRRESTRAADVFLDLSAVDFIDSTGVLVVWQAVTEAAMAGGQLRISSRLSPPVRRIMALTSLLDRLPLFDA